MQELLQMKIIRSPLMIAVFCLLSLTSGAQSATDKQAQPPVAGRTTTVAPNDTRPPEAAREVPISPGDLLEISVFGAPDFHQEVRVSNAGDILLPLIGPVRVADLSPHQASEFIAKKLISGDFYKDPQVSVLVKEYAT